MSELSDVQLAVNNMMIANGLKELPSPITVPTNDMSVFPDISMCVAEKVVDSVNLPFGPADKDGYVLYEHDIVADNAQVDLVNYYPKRYTKSKYVVDKTGKVSKVM